MMNFGFRIADFGFRGEGSSSPRPRAQVQIQNPKSKIQNAFTLTELLIVIALIVLMIALAIPAIGFITGSRSIDGAQNQITAFLGRARAEAIGTQEYAGVMFFLDRRTDRVNMVLVHEVGRPTGALAPVADAVEVWLDLGTRITSDPEFIALPPGVGLQTIDDPGDASAGTRDDGYLGFNTVNNGNGVQVPTLTPYGGVILFDGAGRLVSKRYAFKTYQLDASGNRLATGMGNLLYNPPAVIGADPNHASDPQKRNVVPSVRNITNARSQLGMALYELDAFRQANQDSTGQPPESDWQFVGGGSFTGQPEQSEEAWLDANSTPLLVNRYNGTLIRGE